MQQESQSNTKKQKKLSSTKCQNSYSNQFDEKQLSKKDLNEQSEKHIDQKQLQLKKEKQEEQYQQKNMIKVQTVLDDAKKYQKYKEQNQKEIVVVPTNEYLSKFGIRRYMVKVDEQNNQCKVSVKKLYCNCKQCDYQLRVGGFIIDVKVMIKYQKMERLMVEPFAKGGFGQCYEINENGKQICLKVIRTKENTKPKRQRKVNYYDIIDAVQQIGIGKLFSALKIGPQIITFDNNIDITVYQYCICFRMEMCESLSLKDSKDKTIFSIDDLEQKHKQEEVKKIKIDINKAIFTLHSLNFIHMDIKPANIVKNKQNYVLIDFGLTRNIKQTFQKSTNLVFACGTQQFMCQKMKQLLKINDNHNPNKIRLPKKINLYYNDIFAFKQTIRLLEQTSSSQKGKYKNIRQTAILNLKSQLRSYIQNYPQIDLLQSQSKWRSTKNIFRQNMIKQINYLRYTCGNQYILKQKIHQYLQQFDDKNIQREQQNYFDSFKRRQWIKQFQRLDDENLFTFVSLYQQKNSEPLFYLKSLFKQIQDQHKFSMLKYSKYIYFSELSFYKKPILKRILDEDETVFYKQYLQQLINKQLNLSDIFIDYVRLIKLMMDGVWQPQQYYYSEKYEEQKAHEINKFVENYKNKVNFMELYSNILLKYFFQIFNCSKRHEKKIELFIQIIDVFLKEKQKTLQKQEIKLILQTTSFLLTNIRFDFLFQNGFITNISRWVTIALQILQDQKLQESKQFSLFIYWKSILLFSQQIRIKNSSIQKQSLNKSQDNNLLNKKSEIQLNDIEQLSSKTEKLIYNHFGKYNVFILNLNIDKVILYANLQNYNYNQIRQNLIIILDNFCNLIDYRIINKIQNNNKRNQKFQPISINQLSQKLLKYFKQTKQEVLLIKDLHEQNIQSKNIKTLIQVILRIAYQKRGYINIYQPYQWYKQFLNNQTKQQMVNNYTSTFKRVVDNKKLSFPSVINLKSKEITKICSDYQTLILSKNKHVQLAQFFKKQTNKMRFTYLISKFKINVQALFIDSKLEEFDQKSIVFKQDDFQIYIHQDKKNKSYLKVIERNFDTKIKIAIEQIGLYKLLNEYEISPPLLKFDGADCIVFHDAICYRVQYCYFLFPQDTLVLNNIKSKNQTITKIKKDIYQFTYRLNTLKLSLQNVSLENIAFSQSLGKYCLFLFSSKQISIIPQLYYLSNISQPNDFSHIDNNSIGLYFQSLQQLQDIEQQIHNLLAEQQISQYKPPQEQPINFEIPPIPFYKNKLLDHIPKEYSFDYFKKCHVLNRNQLDQFISKISMLDSISIMKLSQKKYKTNTFNKKGYLYLLEQMKSKNLGRKKLLQKYYYYIMTQTKIQQQQKGIIYQYYFSSQNQKTTQYLSILQQLLFVKVLAEDQLTSLQQIVLKISRYLNQTQNIILLEQNKEKKIFMSLQCLNVVRMYINYQLNDTLTQFIDQYNERKQTLQISKQALIQVYLMFLYNINLLKTQQTLKFLIQIIKINYDLNELQKAIYYIEKAFEIIKQNKQLQQSYLYQYLLKWTEVIDIKKQEQTILKQQK